jgi:hypothetical protein
MFGYRHNRDILFRTFSVFPPQNLDDFGLLCLPLVISLAGTG